ncbi:MAG: penicillin-binding protein 2 [Alphaproteobacteria bacterium]|nr:penicillin-binding protein 2 [Alphaproteobacteria bacterium]
MSVWKYEKAREIVVRTIILSVIFVCISLILIGRLFYLQILQGERFFVLAEKNRTAIRLTMPDRGKIYDRNGVILADNHKIFQAVLIKEQAEDYQKTLDNFKKLIPLEEDEEKRILREIKYKRAFMPIQIKDNLTKEQVVLLHLNAPVLTGIQIEETMIRTYPKKDLTAHVLGYVSLLNDRDTNVDSIWFDLAGYRIGRTGLEQSLESRLRGKPGFKKTEINAMGRTVRLMEEGKSVAGEDLNLTIDIRLQKMAMEALGNEAGTAIVVNVQTGEILSFVSTPSFDPNMFLSSISQKKWNKLMNNQKKPLQNKALFGAYSPGSIFKLVVGLAGLESGVIDPDKRVYCSGATQLGNQKFHCWKHEGHGSLTLREALRHSCDVYFYEMAQKIGVEKIVETAQKLGFGENVVTEMIGDKNGLLPTPEWKMRTKKDDWRMGDTLNLSIGQGFLLTTPLQLVRAIAAIANNGHLIDLHFLKQDKVTSTASLFNNAHLRLIRAGMYDVVNHENGTAYKSRFDLDGKRMAGKTATTQVRRISLKEREEGIKKQKDMVWESRDHALFAAYAPTDKPKYAVIVVVEHGGGGSSAAAPVASKILKEALRLDIEDAKLKEGVTRK